MLHALRTGAGAQSLKLGLLGLLGLAMLGLVFTDIGGFFRNGLNSNTIATVGGDSILLPEFDRLYQQQVRRMNMLPQQARSLGFPQMLLNQEINRRILVKSAQESGLRIPKEFIAKELAKQLETIEIGKTPREKLEFLVRQTGQSEAQIIQSLQDDLSIDLISATLPTTRQAPQNIIDQLYNFQNQERIAEVIRIKGKAVLPNPTFSEEQITAFYEQSKTRFTIPEKRSFKFSIITPEDLRKDISISKEDIQRYYNNNQDEFSVPEQVALEQLIFDDRTQATDALARIKNGTETLTSIKDGARYQQTMDYTTQALPENLRLAVERSKENTLLSDPIKTPLGWHVVRLHKRTPETIAPLKTVQDSIKRQLTDSELDKRFYAVAEDIDAMAIETGSLDDIAKIYNLSVIKVNDVERFSDNNRLKTLGDGSKEEALAHAFTLPKNEISPLIEIENGGFALLEVTHISEAKPKPLADVRQDIIKDLTLIEQGKKANQISQDIIKSYRHDKTSLKELARKYNVPLTQTERLKRTSRSQSAGIINEVFTIENKDDISFVIDGDETVVVRLTDVIPVSNPNRKDPVFDDLNEQISQNLTLETQQMFIKAWRDRIGATINGAALYNTYSKPATDELY